MPTYVPNLRDVGGMTTFAGAPLARGRVLRSAMPVADDLAPDGFAWPPSLVIDLRSAGEFESDHPLLSAGARVVNLPLLAALRPNSADYRNVHELYMVLLDHAAPLLVDLVREVGGANGPTLIHCAAGKDRTGISIALLLRLLDVSRDQVVTDYLATSAAATAIEDRLRALPGAHLRPPPSPALLAVSSDAINAVLDVWDAHDDGVRGWFRAAGGDDGLIGSLREGLIG